MSDEQVCKACRENADKSTWGDGPWMTEPDHVFFEHAGLPCILHRNHQGAWCGYAAVPPGHPFHGKSYNDISDLDVHGGLTYAEACAGHVCHVPKPGEPDNVWWFGFDCHHAFDLAPKMESYFRSKGMERIESDIYRDLAYVRAETESLAEQLAKAA